MESEVSRLKIPSLYFRWRPRLPPGTPIPLSYPERMHKGLLWSPCNSIFKYGGSLLLRVSNGRQATTERTESSGTGRYCRPADRFSNMEARKQFAILWKRYQYRSNKVLDDNRTT